MERDAGASHGPAPGAGGADAPSGPLYRQVYVALRDDILAGAFDGTGALPSEHALEARFGVSRITVRRALDELAARGLITRRQGRPTLVNPRPGQRPLVAPVERELLNTFAIGLETEVQLLGCDVIGAERHVAEALGIEPGAPVLWVVRLRRSEGRPFCQTTAFVPAPLAHAIPREALATTPLLVLLERAGVSVSRARQAIAAVPARAPAAGFLEVAEGTPLLEMERVVHDQDDRPVQYIVALFRADMYRYRVELAATARASEGEPEVREL
jgi:GntR family transcriptional regulator